MADAELTLPRIDSLEVLEVCVPRSERTRITTSYATLPDAHHALVRVRAGGLLGIGEAPAERWWTGEDATSVRNAIERYLAPALVGQSLSIRPCVVAMNRALAWNPYAKAAVEMALWDLLGKVAGLPLRVLLGGSAVEAVPIKYVVGIVDPDRARDEALTAREAGFSVLKLKVGGALADDVALVATVIGAAGPSVRVGVDANGGWSLTTALAALVRLAELGVSFVEQPVSAEHPAAMAAVTARSPIPVVAHESIFTVRDGMDAASRGLAHVWSLTPSTHGGLLATMDLLAIARATGIPCLLGSTVELGVATAFLAHVGAAFPEISGSPVPSDVLGPLYHDGDVVAPPIEIVAGTVRVPSGSGLGVELDEEQVRRFEAHA